MRIPMTSFDALLALGENKNPKKKPPLMAYQKRRTSLVHVIFLKPLPLPNYDSRAIFPQLAKYVREGLWKIFRTTPTKAIAVAGRLGQSRCCSILYIYNLLFALAP